ncbi:hypothetical protein BDW59DRAFT_158644 [Aspergillus cavernicola]|uniref:F-box domain-containing protein n=1 Tax=Aspergillus cavernicola TaxID=176166 RepID=A0ABR4IRD8_9EURO
MANNYQYTEGAGYTYQFGNQPNHLMLPMEILHIINEYVAGGRFNKPNEPGNFSGKLPPHVCLVNRHWSHIFTPVLYTHFMFHGNVNKLKSLWGFLRTVVQRQELAAHVKELTLTTWDIFADFHPDDMREAFMLIWENTKLFDMFCTPETLKPTRNAATLPEMAYAWFRANYLNKSSETIKHGQRAGIKAWYAKAFYKLHREWMKPLLAQVLDDRTDSARRTLRTGQLALGIDGGRVPYQGPLVALLIAVCPELLRLNCDVWGAGLDPYYERVMRIATGKHPLPAVFRNRHPLSRLEVLRLAGRQPPVRGLGTNTHRGEVSLSDVIPYWQLPNLKDLTVLNATMYNAIAETKIPSTIQSITLRGEFSHLHLPSLFALTPNLRHVSLKIATHDSIVDHTSPNGPFRYGWTWRMLYRLKDQLEYLDLHQSPFPDDLQHIPTTDENGDPVVPYCPPLREFTNLRQLNITPMGLYGHQCDHMEGHKFPNHLPPNLISLGIYTDDHPWTQNYFTMLDTELEGAAKAGTVVNGGSLRAIVVDRDGGLLPTEKLEAVARLNGMFFDFDGQKYLLFAGKKTRWGHMNTDSDREYWEDLEDEYEPWRVIPRGMEVSGIKGRLRVE